MGKTILTPNQHLLLDEATRSQIITDNYYLTGGTALSEFYFQHRYSEDLDFFSETEINEKNIAAWIQKVTKKLNVKVQFETLTGQLIYHIAFPRDTVTIDFAYFPFSVLGSYKKYKNLRISSIEDIAANKLQAILTRVRGRDYFDLYEIVTRGYQSVEQIRRNYRLKYDVHIPDEQIARSFAKVLDAKDMPRFLENVNWKEVEEFFLSEVKKLEPKIIT